MTLADACQTRPPKSEARAKLAPHAEVSFLPMEDLGIESRIAQATQTRPMSAVVGSYTYFADGDVLLAKITPCFENGKLGIATGLVNGIGFGSSEYLVFRPTPAVTKEWLFYFLSRQSFREEGVTRMTGAVGHRRVSKEFIDACTIPVPPLAEQDRIVGILDEAFEGIATAKTNAERNLRNSSALFDSFRHGVFARRGPDWTETTLDAISTNLDSKRVPITKDARSKGTYPYYGASGIVDYVGDYIFEGDALLVSEDGANLLARSTPIAFSVSGKYWVNNHAHVLRFPSMATQRFVEFYLASIVLDAFVTGAAQPKLTQRALNSIPIPIPPSIVKQGDIVADLDRMVNETSMLRTVYETKVAALDELKKAMLEKAFAGEL